MDNQNSENNVSKVFDNTPKSAINYQVVKKDDLRIEEIDIAYLYQIATWEENLSSISEAVNSALGLALPELGQVISNNEISILASQPNKWLIISNDDIGNKLQLFCDNTQATLLDQSSAYSIIEISGENATKRMQQLAFIDFSNNEKSIITTQLADYYSGLVQTLDEKENRYYRIYITRTMAKSFWQEIT